MTEWFTGAKYAIRISFMIFMMEMLELHRGYTICIFSDILQFDGNRCIHVTSTHWLYESNKCLWCGSTGLWCSVVSILVAVTDIQEQPRQLYFVRDSIWCHYEACVSDAIALSTTLWKNTCPLHDQTCMLTWYKVHVEKLMYWNLCSSFVLIKNNK